MTRGHVRRDAVLRRLNTLPDAVRVVLLLAPVGYGKTTAMRQWARQRTKDDLDPPGWLTVRPVHDDPLRMVQDLARLLPGDDPTGALDGWGEPDARSLVPALAAALHADGAPRVLVLEDLHRLRSRRSLDLLIDLSERLPAGTRLIATADRRPAWRTARLLTQDRYLELGADALAFDRAESSVYLRSAGLDLPDAAVDELVRRTEGWPTGLRLAANVLREAADAVAAVHDVSGASEEIADFFRTRVLASLPTETVRFLRRSAVLDVLSGPLGDAALDMVGCATRLAEVHALGLFLYRRDDLDGWYGYQRLFAEMLTSDLRHLEPRAHRDIQRRASRWYGLQERPVEAIEHAIAGGHNLTAARLIVAHTQALNSRGEIGRVPGWLEQLDEDTFELYPPLAVMATWVWALTGDVTQARRALTMAQAGSFEGPLPDGSVSLESAILRARAALVPDGVETMLVDARKAVLLEPPGSAWHTMAALLLGVAELVNGHGDAAQRWFEQAARFGRSAQGPGAVTATAQLALLAAERHDWMMAELCLRECVERRESGGLNAYMPSMLSYLAAALVALEAGAVEQSRLETGAALALYARPAPDAFPWLAVQAAVTLGHLLLASKDVAAAQAKLADARRQLALLPTVGVMAEWVERLAAVVDAAVAHTSAEETSGLTTAELRVLRQLPTHLSLAHIADQQSVSRNTIKGHVASIYAKLGVANRAEAVSHADRHGLLDARGQDNDSPPG